MTPQYPISYLYLNNNIVATNNPIKRKYIIKRPQPLQGLTSGYPILNNIINVYITQHEPNNIIENAFVV